MTWGGQEGEGCSVEDQVNHKRGVKEFRKGERSYLIETVT